MMAGEGELLPGSYFSRYSTVGVLTITKSLLPGQVQTQVSSLVHSLVP